jgi:AcrR family transcriptional regulator
VERRKPDGDERRRTLCDAAIRLLADEGAKGLSHPRVDRQAGVPPGSTSFYFRTRSALLLAVAKRLCQLDLADFTRAAEALDGNDASAHEPSALATTIMASAHEPGLSRTKARFELLLHANREPAIADVFQTNFALFTELHRDLVIRSQPNGQLDRAVIDEQVGGVMSFVSGVLMRLAAGQRPVTSAEHLDQLLAGVINGIAHARHVGPTRPESLADARRASARI